MRRTDREITDFSEICDILRRCQTVRLAINDEGAPYIVPLSFGLEVNGNIITLYFHAAAAGKKLTLLRRDARVCVEGDIFHRVADLTTYYESVIGTGTVREVTDEAEKAHALHVLLSYWDVSGFVSKDCESFPHTVVLALTLDSVTGKKHLSEQFA